MPDGLQVPRAELLGPRPYWAFQRHVGSADVKWQAASPFRLGVDAARDASGNAPGPGPGPPRAARLGPGAPLPRRRDAAMQVRSGWPVRRRRRRRPPTSSPRSLRVSALVKLRALSEGPGPGRGPNATPPPFARGSICQCSRLVIGMPLTRLRWRRSTAAQARRPVGSSGLLIKPSDSTTPGG